MSIVLTGNPANVTSPLFATVVSLANNGGGLIRVQTSAAHLFGQNDRVLMAASPAVGIFSINVIDSTHFDLQGSTFSTTGTGTVQDLSLTPQIQIPTDGDTFSLQLSGMLSALQGLLDRTQYLRETTGQYRLAQFQTLGHTFGISGQWASVTTTSTSLSLLTPSVVTLPWVVSGIQTNDILEVSLATSTALQAVSNEWYELSIVYAIASSPPSAGAYSIMPNSGQLTALGTGVLNPINSSICLNGAVAAGSSGNLYLQPGATSHTASSQSIGLTGDVNVVCKVWRPTGSA